MQIVHHRSRHQKFFLIGRQMFVVALTLIASHQVSGIERASFERESIDPDISIGYGLSIGDVDGDQRLDIVLADKSEIVWYQNPGGRSKTWNRFVMARQLTQRDNVCVSVRDLDGDGKVEVAVGAGWNPGNTTDPNASGAVFFLVRPSDPKQLWGVEPLTPHDPTVHRMHWVKWQNQGEGIEQYRLLVLPLHGVGNQNGQGEPVFISAYQVDAKGKQVGQPTRIPTGLHMAHNFDIVESATGTESVVVAGREGLVMIQSGGGEQDSVAELEQVVDAPDGRGAGEVRRFEFQEHPTYATIEPMHGQQVVVYQAADDGKWRRRVLDASLNQGHAVACGELTGNGQRQIVAGWRANNAENQVGIRLYDYNQEQDKWETRIVDENKMACEDIKLADFDQDGRLDIVAAGRATNNLVIYWNEN